MNRSKWAASMAVLTLCLAGIAGAFVSNVAAQAAMQDFVLVNKTGVEIYAVYVTPHNDKNWGSDILGVDTLPVNESIDISFTRREKAKLWDIRVENEDGEFIEWESINLYEISSVTLYFNNGKATAVFDDFQPELNGTWAGFYDNGSPSPYIWLVSNNGASITVENIGGGGKISGRGTVKGNAIRINNFATPNGKVSSAGDKITWSDGVVWKRVPDLNGDWVGYYDDGTRSPFRWRISQSGIGINIQDAKGGAARSRGTLIGLRVTATDFATKNGTLFSGRATHNLVGRSCLGQRIDHQQETKYMKKIITITGAAVLTAAMTGCSFSVGMDANNSTANAPAANAPAKKANTAANANSANKTGDAKPALHSEKRPEGEAKTAKKNAVPANWVYIYDEAKGYGFSMPEGSTGETETVEGIDIFGAITPAPSEVDVIVLAYKDAKRTKEDLLKDAVEFLEGLGQKVTPGALKGESDEYAVADATSIHPERGKGKLRILVGTDVTDNYVMIIGTDDAKFAANEAIIDQIWGSFEMWSGGGGAAE